MQYLKRNYSQNQSIRIEVFVKQFTQVKFRKILTISYVLFTMANKKESVCLSVYPSLYIYRSDFLVIRFGIVVLQMLKMYS